MIARFGRTVCIVSVLLACPLAAIPASAQNARSTLGTVQQLASHAEIIFHGTVLAIEHQPAVTPDSLATVRIRFLVREAVRGATVGQTLTISEWQGLWDSGQRYRVGQNVILFLHAPSAASGLTSTVGGEGGRLLVDRYGMVGLPRELSTSTPSMADDYGENPGKPQRIRARELMNLIRRAVVE